MMRAPWSDSLHTDRASLMWSKAFLRDVGYSLRFNRMAGRSCKAMIILERNRKERLRESSAAYMRKKARNGL